MKTHQVIDNMYHEDEPFHYCKTGTKEECDSFVEEQNKISLSPGLEVVPLTKEEFETVNN